MIRILSFHPDKLGIPFLPLHSRPRSLPTSERNKNACSNGRRTQALAQMTRVMLDSCRLLSNFHQPVLCQTHGHWAFSAFPFTFLGWALSPPTPTGSPRMGCFAMGKKKTAPRLFFYVANFSFFGFGFMRWRWGARF